jgi:hypothetical protein
MKSISEMIGKWWDEETPRSEGLDQFGWGAASLEAYLRGDFSPYAKIAAKEGIEYGIGKSGSDWLVGPKGNFTPVGSGLASGGSTLAAGLLTGNTEGLAGRTAASGGGAMAGNYLGQQAMKSGASGAAAGALGAGVGGIASGLYEGLTKGKVSKGTEFSTIGGMVGSIFGPLGTAAGSLIGGLAGGFLGKNKPSIGELSKTESGSPVLWDGTKFVPQKPLDARVSIDGEDYGLSPQQKAGLAKKLWQASVEKANELNSRFIGKDLSEEEATWFDRMKEMYGTYQTPEADADWQNAYQKWAKNAGSDLPLELWKKQVEEKQGWTDSPLRPSLSTNNLEGDYKWLKEMNKPEIFKLIEAQQETDPETEARQKARKPVWDNEGLLEQRPSPQNQQSPSQNTFTQEQIDAIRAQMLGA